MDEEDKPRHAVQKVGQEQIHGLLFSDTLSWQSIIYDLINTEQLEPWDIDISLLAQKYLERIKELEEENFFISSKVLLAAAILLRMKSEILLHHDLPGLDEVLFGKKEEKKYHQERIELEGEVPGLIARTPLPRFKKVTLEELMSALGKAITTENRRIRRIVVKRQQEFETALSLPKTKINLKDQISGVYRRLREIFKSRENPYPFSELAGKSTEERVATFVPLLHLDNQQKVWLEQEGHFSEIWILLKHLYEKQNLELLEKMKKEAEIEIDLSDLTPEEQERAEKVEEEFKDPLGTKESPLKIDDEEK
ncbi:hypothetical protein FJZ18_02675 [Candidatus Pacearchaeota archaeon]|nr:hypothetical protein [Candidatus Pacearchaeota archaeon]